MLVASSCSLKQKEQDYVSDDTTSTIILSDSAAANETDYDSLFSLSSYLTGDVSDTALVQEISEPVALMVLPTADQVSAMEKEYGEDFATIPMTPLIIIRWLKA